MIVFTVFLLFFFLAIVFFFFFLATVEQVEKAKEVIKKLTFKFSSDNFENPGEFCSTCFFFFFWGGIYLCGGLKETSERIKK